MPKTQYFTATSIDGFIADQDNGLDWLFQTEGGDGYEEFFDQVGALAMGATTYEWILEHEHPLENQEKWPYGQTPCWVFTHRQLPAVPGARLSFESGDVRPVHRQMSAAAGDRNVWLVGGGDLVGQFADHGLLDEIILSIAPATLGGGAPLLPRRLMPAELTLTACGRNGQFASLRYSVSRLASQ
ncbi:MAG TPA: dihydrofolate reductase family protein [Streptosporangiaceae bacterium]|nr:dihydrofolate reductase family protein [Streptosporangiaceae bacterium]